jgi:hypothetical protein
MSWPDDNQPRFTVTTVYGGHIRQETTTAGNTNRPLAVCAQVVDRAYAHKVVREYASRGGISQERTIVEAARYAAELNAKDTA